MRLKVAILMGCLVLSNLATISTAQDDVDTTDATVIEGGDETPTDETPVISSDASDDLLSAEASSTTTTTTTTLPPVEPAGSSKQYTFTSGGDGAGLTVSLTFEQQEDDYMTMHCVIATSNSAYGTLEKFCNDDAEFEKPSIYLVKDHTNCNDLSSMDSAEVIEVQSIAHDLKPNDDATAPTFAIKWKDLDGNCFAMLQTKKSGGGRRFGRQEDTEEVTEAAAPAESTTVADRGGCEILDTTTTTTTTTSTTTTLVNEDEAAVTEEEEVEEIVVPDGSRIGARRSGRMIFDGAPLTRTFSTISIGDLSILSLGTVFTAPTIVNAAPGPVVVSFGSFGGYTYNPWSTLPYLQLPGWTATTVYAVVGGLFVVYIFALLGSYIPGVSDFVDTISGVIGQSSASRRWSKFVNYSNDRLFDGLTTFVHNSINRFSRRNTYKPPQPQYTRRTDLDYDYYAYGDDQHYAEDQYFRK